MDMSRLRPYWAEGLHKPGSSQVPVFRAAIDWNSVSSRLYRKPLLWCIRDSGNGVFSFFAAYYDDPSIGVPDVGKYSAADKLYALKDIAQMAREGKLAEVAVTLAMEASL